MMPMTRSIERKLTLFRHIISTPWKRIASYEVPQDLEACPEGGCICIVRPISFSNRLPTDMSCNSSGPGYVFPIDFISKMTQCIFKIERFPMGTYVTIIHGQF